MNKKLLDQKRLLKTALKKIEEIETIDKVFGGVDDDHVNETNKRLVGEYAQTMTELTDLLLNEQGLVAIKMPERKQKITVREVEGHKL